MIAKLGGQDGRRSISAVSILVGAPIAALSLVFALLAVLSKGSLTLGLYAVGLGAVGAGLLVRRWRLLAGCGSAMLLFALVWRGSRGPAPGVEVTVWPDGGTRTLGRLYEERDGTVPVATLLRMGHVVDQEESRDFVPGLVRVYRQMQREVGPVPTPAVPTYLGLESPSAFDTVVFRPERTPRFAVVFLHGYAGNFSVFCWIVARGVLPLGGVTVCPSVGPQGYWWQPSGATTLERTLTRLGQLGFRRVILAGLSNGGIGASRLALRVRESLSGLMLVSGCDPDAPSVGLPTLVLQGARDTRIPAAVGRACAEHNAAEYVELDSGHFMLVDRDEDTAQAIRSWLQKVVR
jgi:pimeloyl-ACP methyl ester carboxylesterase